MVLRAFQFAVVLACCSLTATSARADELPMTLEQFKLWRDYQDALQDERVQKMPEGKRFGAIARNFKVSEKDLRVAVDKGDKHGESVGKLAEEAIRAALADTELGPRLKTVRVDTSAAHVVTYLVWKAAKPDAFSIDKEVCTAAARARQASPITSTFKFEVRDHISGSLKVFEGLISGSAAGRIRESSIVDFASTRYLKLFEKVSRMEL
ncbi:MAG TPA: hypothetical protein DFS52_22645 [Myxococcales bacterium]|jgi:hypothetical protein|nr:hypothetical protein [Myxococcales bacterium]